MQPGETGVTKLVAGQMRDASTRTSAADDLVESGRGQRQTATWPLQHDKDLIGCRGARPFGVVVGGHRGEELSRDRHDPLATALALGDEQATLSRVQVGHPQAQYLSLIHISEPTRPY